MRAAISFPIWLGLCVTVAASAEKGPLVGERLEEANARAINRAVKAILDELQSDELTEAQRNKLYSDKVEALRKRSTGLPVLLRIKIVDVRWEAADSWAGRKQPARAILTLDESAKLERANPKYRGSFSLPMSQAEALKVQKGSMLVVRGTARIEGESSRLDDDPEGSWIVWFGCDQGLGLDKPSFRIEPPAKKPG